MVTAKIVTKKATETTKSAVGKTTVKTTSVDSEDKAAGAEIAPVHVVRRKELVERIAEKSGMKPNLIKSVLDAVLLEIGDALSGGESVRVQPLGQLSVNRRKELPDGEVLVCKLRRRNQTIDPEVTTLASANPSATAAE